MLPTIEHMTREEKRKEIMTRIETEKKKKCEPHDILQNVELIARARE